MEQNKKVSLDVNVVQGLLNYLQTKPYAEVAEVIRVLVKESNMQLKPEQPEVKEEQK